MNIFTSTYAAPAVAPLPRTAVNLGGVYSCQRGAQAPSPRTTASGQQRPHSAALGRSPPRAAGRHAEASGNCSSLCAGVALTHFLCAPNSRGWLGPGLKNLVLRSVSVPRVGGDRSCRGLAAPSPEGRDLSTRAGSRRIRREDRANWTSAPGGGGSPSRGHSLRG